MQFIISLLGKISHLSRFTVPPCLNLSWKVNFLATKKALLLGQLGVSMADLNLQMVEQYFWTKLAKSTKMFKSRFCEFFKRNSLSVLVAKKLYRWMFVLLPLQIRIWKKKFEKVASVKICSIA